MRQYIAWKNVFTIRIVYKNSKSHLSRLGSSQNRIDKHEHVLNTLKDILHPAIKSIYSKYYKPHQALNILSDYMQAVWTHMTDSIGNTNVHRYLHPLVIDTFEHFFLWLYQLPSNLWYINWSSPVKSPGLSFLLCPLSPKWLHGIDWKEINLIA